MAKRVEMDRTVEQLLEMAADCRRRAKYQTRHINKVVLLQEANSYDMGTIIRTLQDDIAKLKAERIAKENDGD